MNKSRQHPQYWTVRFMLAFAIGAPPTALYSLLAMQPGTMGGGLASGGFDWAGVAIMAGAGMWFAGVIWMIRIFRGPSDDPPPWRYRAR